MVVLIYTYPGYLSYFNSTTLPTLVLRAGRVGNLDVVPSFHYPPLLSAPTLPYIEASTHPYSCVSYLFLLQYPTISCPVIYTIGLLYPDTILHHSLMRSIEIGPNRPRAETTQGLNDSPLRLNRPKPKLGRNDPS